MRIFQGIINKLATIPYHRSTPAPLEDSTESGISPFLRFAEPGHFHSPIPDINEIRKRKELLFNRNIRSLPGINLHENQQLNFLESISSFYKELPFPETKSPSMNYYYKNEFFSYGDAIILYSIFRYIKPKWVIEIGSGFSSALMLDIDRLFLNHSTNYVFIEPHPNRLKELLSSIKNKSKYQIVEKLVQDTNLTIFQQLSAGDILFIDSSHVAKIGSDVNYIFFKILPVLKPEVIIHFHDILWPFEYPERWVLAGRAWNEAYMLHSFLQYNNAFEILYFNSFMGNFYSDVIANKMPMMLKKIGGSIWIKKTSVC